MTPPRPVNDWPDWEARRVEMRDGYLAGRWSWTWYQLSMGKLGPKGVLAYIFPRWLGWLNCIAAEDRRIDDERYPGRRPG